MRFRLGAALAALLVCGLPSASAQSHALEPAIAFVAKVDARGFIDVWQLRHDVAIVEARYVADSADSEESCEREGDAADDALDAPAHRRLEHAEAACKADMRRKVAAYQKVFTAFNRAWLPAMRNAMAHGDTVAEVIVRQCATTPAFDRRDIESTCDEEPKKSIAVKRLNEIGFVPALNLQFPNWQASSGKRKTQLDNQQRALDAIRHGALGFDTMEVSTNGNVASDADELQSYRNYAVIEAALQDAPDAFTVTPGSFDAGWNTGQFAALRLNRKPLTPGYLTWGRRLYFGGGSWVYTGPHYWRSNPTKVFVPRGDSQEEIAVSGATDAQFRRELAETLAATSSSIGSWLKQDPRWAVFLLHRVGLHEWVPERTRSTTQRLNPAWLGNWKLESQTRDWDNPMQPATGYAQIKRDWTGEIHMTLSATPLTEAEEPFPNVNDCPLRYSGGVTYLPDASPNDDIHTALGYIDAQEARAALAPLNRRKRYKQVLMECTGGEFAHSDRMRFFLLARDRMLEIGMDPTDAIAHPAVRQYRRIR